MVSSLALADILDIADRPRRGSSGAPDLFKKPVPPGHRKTSDGCEYRSWSLLLFNLRKLCVLTKSWLVCSVFFNKREGICSFGLQFHLQSMSKGLKYQSDGCALCSVERLSEENELFSTFSQSQTSSQNDKTSFSSNNRQGSFWYCSSGIPCCLSLLF